ncbi:DNA/RNA endonuclease G [Microbacterium sp. EYE_5]|uniref:DUF6286 domain-containing protein n=1 Tax=unclassified Microbacterium TaxID=2609290 RepID=UPI00200313E9|nr:MULTISPECIES: DUF6286 domain-containing protein [unclassified Microbacterium]MCK6081597.1 DNA/RNA endonuclease G [Microbacterium sp. EYE_382]MCK6086867.1 DNA/RNA endonuclease G [Microbacterium sp. EYE_384]MCK6123635.1 DNA/RNA endonuclease G [Microbacterium sp. EYE_80]MCK6126544.1 DNA/RNA endonuclease G [Microbacterium sp. EYE_79]MCK6142551.1 DNA/RNA endonuclease G [Microbacterium sp. EYE_39]
MSEPVLRRVVRRETHSPRSVAFAVVVLLTIVACLYLAVETVLSLASQPALLVRPIDALAWLAALPADVPVGAVIAGGLAVAVVGVWLILLAVTPGRLSKHEMDAGGRAALVDNGVLAAAIAQRVSDETGLARDRVTVGVAHRSVDVSVKPGAGIPVDRAQVNAVAEAELSGFKLTRPLRTRVRVERTDDEEKAA